MKGTSIITIVASLVFAFENSNAQTWSGATPGNIYYNSGNVGIGLSNPATKLEIRGGSLRISDVDARGLIISHDANGTPFGGTPNNYSGARQFKLTGWSTNAANQGSDEKDIIHFDGFHLLLEKDNGGNVGIGTDTPRDKLHVNGNLSLKPDEATTPSYINFKRASDGWIPARFGQAYAQQGYGGHLIFETNASASTTNLVERMRITHTGYVGIGTANPGHKLQIHDGAIQIVNPGVSTSYSLIFRDEDTANSSYFFHRKTPNYQILGSNRNGTGVLRKLGFAIGGGDNEADVKMTLDENGNLLIGKTTQANTAYKLDVNGSIRSNEVVVNTTGADFVFKDSYKLMKLEDVERYIEANNHLPEIKSAAEMQENGLSVGETETKLLQKVEELTLYMIELNKKVNSLIEENERLKGGSNGGGENK